MQEDKLLVQQTITGDEQAFHRLIMKYYTAIYALIMSWIKNPEDAKDLTQEVFLEAYQGLASLRQPEQFNFWLKKIAKYHCQDWLRKRREPYLELSEDMISDAPSIDETLILRETLAKVMKAIDELPETESQLLKERYLDDASYDDLEAKHGLSQSALAMRLLRAKRHVREKIKLLSGVFALSWQDLAKKIFVGGVEAVKISAKAKIMAIGVAGVLVLGGTGVIFWNHQRPEQIISEPTINQALQKTSVVSSAKHVSSKKNVSDENIKKPKDNQNKEENLSKDDEDLKKWIAEININSSNIESKAWLHKDSQAQEQSLSTEQIDPEKYYSQFDKLFNQGPVPLNMVGIPIRDANGYAIENSKGQRLPDGAMLVYYRRKDGSLIRKVEKPDGTILRWIIGWTDITPYYEIASKSWSDE